MTTGKKRASKAELGNKLTVEGEKGEDSDLLHARFALSPIVRHAYTASTFAAPMFGDDHKPAIEHDVKVLKEAIDKAKQGDKAFASELLAAQAVSLDSMFTELARRSAVNMGQHMNASERYMRLAFRAQANCRATLEALTKLHQPREQTVKHVHVNDGGQAVVADQVHQHGGPNGKSVKQSHATGTAGSSTKMLSEDTQGDSVPITSSKRKEEMPHARRD